MICKGGFPGGSVVKNLPAMQETWVWSLGPEDPLEEEMATHSSIPAWSIPRTEEPGGLFSMGLQRVGHDWATNTTLHWSRGNREREMAIYGVYCSDPKHWKEVWAQVLWPRTSEIFIRCCICLIRSIAPEVGKRGDSSFQTSFLSRWAVLWSVMCP